MGSGVERTWEWEGEKKSILVVPDWGMEEGESSSFGGGGVTKT